MLDGNLNDRLDREWLLTNGCGGFAASTAIGCPTRRQHGWLVWTRPGTLDRWLLWAGASEHVVVAGRTYLLANFEFNNAVDPHGYQHLTDFTIDSSGDHSIACWTYQLGAVEVRKSLWLQSGAERVHVDYKVAAPQDVSVKLQVWPLIACRSIHSLRRKSADPFEIRDGTASLSLRYRLDSGVSMSLAAATDREDVIPEFSVRPDWWYNFKYRQEAALGLDFGEDLYVPGSFSLHGEGVFRLHLCAEAPADLRQTERIAAESAKQDCPNPRTTDSVEGVLAAAARQFVIRRGTDAAADESAIVLAGYHDLTAYTRDTCVAVPGLLAETGNHRAVAATLRNIAARIDHGLIPHEFGTVAENTNRFPDEPLWFVYAVDAYCQATGDDAPDLRTAALQIVSQYAEGIRLPLNGRGVFTLEPRDGLLHFHGPVAGSWMDAHQQGRWITPRHGAPIELSALWHHALLCAARWIQATDAAASARWSAMAESTAAAIRRKYVTAECNSLADVVTADGTDWSLRPNQLIALGLPHSPIPVDVGRRALDTIASSLLTPWGFRTLDPADSRYCGEYCGGDWQREQAAHQGTAYLWLIGFHTDAVMHFAADANSARVAQRERLAQIIERLRPGGALRAPQMYDGAAPHRARGRIHQAWDVAELWRAWRRVSHEHGVHGMAARSDLIRDAIHSATNGHSQSIIASRPKSH